VGKVLPFVAAPPAYPLTANSLAPAERTLLLAIRWWVSALRHGVDPLARVWENLTTTGAAAAAPSLDALMATVARTGRRPIAIHRPCCPNLSADEKHLMRAATLAQVGDSRLAQQALHNALLSADGAALVLGSLERLGELFAELGLFFSQRRSLAEGVRSICPRGGKSPSGSELTLY